MHLWNYYKTFLGFHGFWWYFVLFLVGDASRVRDYMNPAKNLENKNIRETQQYAPAPLTAHI